MVCRLPSRESIEGDFGYHVEWATTTHDKLSLVIVEQWKKRENGMKLNEN